MSKVISISEDREFFRIGDTTDSSEWYKVGDKVKSFSKYIKEGAQVKIGYDTDKNSGQKVLNFLQKLQDGVVPESPKKYKEYKPTFKKETIEPTEVPYSTGKKKRTTGEDIMVQSAVKSASTAICCLQGQLDKEEFIAYYKKLIDVAYDKLMVL